MQAGGAKTVRVKGTTLGRLKRTYWDVAPGKPLALIGSSGLLDGVNGQVIMVDRGTSFFDNLMRLYNERDALSL